MNDDQRIEIVSMRLIGRSLQEIADHFGCSKQCISDVIFKTSDELCGIRAKRKTTCKCVYPNIAKWMEENRASYADIAGGRSNEQTFRRFLTNRGVSTSKNVVDRILQVTGLTYEEAFATESGEGR